MNTTTNKLGGNPTFMSEYVPDNCPAAFGFRAILKGGTIDILSDHIHKRGEFTLTDKLKAATQKALPAIRKAVQKGWDNGNINPRETNPVTVFQTDDLIVKADTRASYGYLYVTAYFNPDFPDHAYMYGKVK